ncbi:MAG: sensor histidine kinase, partial [Thermoanaerobaculia bacterium]
VSSMPPPRLEADLGSGPRVLNVAVSPFPGATPGSRARVLVLYDATETARLERALADRERLAALGTLSAGVAHEVNTPLAGVAGFARLLLDETPSDDPRRTLVEKIERQAFRASRLVGSLLDLARGKPREFVRLDPAALAEETGWALADETAARRASLDVEAAPSLPAVSGHRDALVQVLVNLAKNGLEAVTSPRAADDPPPAVTLRVAADDGHVLFSVEDNGPGLTEAEAARVFEPFYSTKTAKGGTGLGLAIARDIIQAHGGTLTVTSPGERGARFTVSLPAAT